MKFDLVDILIVFAEVWVYYRMGQIFLKNKKIKKSYRILTVIVFILMQQGLLFVDNIVIALGLELILYLVFYHILFRGKLIIKILIYLSTMVMFTLFTFINGSILSNIKEFGNFSFSSVKFISISNLFAMIFVLLVLDMLFKGKNTNANIRWGLFLLIPFTTLIGILLALIFDRKSLFESSIAFPVIILFINIFSYYIMANNILIREEKTRKLMSTKITENKIMAYKELSKRYDERRKFIHDYENNLIFISDMINKNKIDECSDYIQSLTNRIKISRNIVNTGNSLIDTLISIKYDMALNKGIYLVLNLCYLGELTSNEYELFSILSNLLDNAIEACEKLEKYDKKIHLDISNDVKLRIKIRNPIEKKVEIYDELVETSKTDKENHGLGMRIIRDFVKKNNGEIFISTDNNEFTYIIEMDN